MAPRTSSRRRSSKFWQMVSGDSPRRNAWTIRIERDSCARYVVVTVSLFEVFLCHACLDCTASWKRRMLARRSGYRKLPHPLKPGAATVAEPTTLAELIEVGR